MIFFCRSLLIKITFSVSSPSVKVPHELHFWLILLVIINCEHHIPDLTNVNSSPCTISFLVGSGGAATRGKKIKKEE